MTVRKTMNVSLTPVLERVVADRVASGRYRSASEVVRAALRLLEKDEGGSTSPSLTWTVAAHEGSKSEKQKMAEAEVDNFRKELGPFVVAVETTRMAMVFTDAHGSGNPISFANNSFLSLTGYDCAEVLGQSFNSLMGRAIDPEALADVEAAFAGSFERDLEIRCRRNDGSVFWAAFFISPVRDASGDVVQHFASIMDLTKHKQEQAHCKVLIDELNHRVKNNLSTVQSIVFQALRNASDPEVIRESIESRLFALSKSHDLLTRESWNGAGLLEIVNAAMEPFRDTNGRAERFVVKGNDIRLPPKATLALAIGLHELATNAVKYGAWSNEVGSILIGWTIEPAPDGDQLILHWQEKDGPPVTPPTRKGFGARVLERGLAHELEGSVHLTYPTDGVACTIQIPARRGAGRG